MADEGLYCSTAGEYFHDKDSIQEHYRSAFHRYNLKRKIAGLPPVTREWYEARKAQLAAAAATPAQRLWTDPLTKKRFSSENTYLAFVRSNKYRELVRASGRDAPAPIISVRRQATQGDEAPTAAAGAQPASAPVPVSAAKPAGFVAKKASPAVAFAAAGAGAAAAGVTPPPRGEEDDEKDSDEGSEEESDWETASEEEENVARADGGGDDAAGAESKAAATDAETNATATGAPSVAAGAADADADAAADDATDAPPLEWVEWDPLQSLFDGQSFETIEENLAYMHKTFGFYLPDAEFLADPEGLLKYLGAKLAVGHIPLYVSGQDPDPKQFRSLWAVRRHMVDTGNCRMLYDGNEEEYEDYYDYGESDEDEDEAGAEEGGTARGDDAAAAEGAREASTSGRAGGAAGDDAASAIGVLSVAGRRGGAGGGGALALSGGRGSGRSAFGDSAAASYELAVPRPGGGTRVLGTREFARYYRQNHRGEERHAGVLAARVLAQYRRLAITCAPTKEVVAKRKAEKRERKVQAKWMGISIRRNINDNLPKNVPY